jgi:hypothetical protein
MKIYDPGRAAYIKTLVEEENAYLRAEFRYLNLNRETNRYTQEQKGWATDKAMEIGVRATARLLSLQRKTIQRWLRERGVKVRRCPRWVYEWAHWRKKRRQKWERIRAYRRY